MRVLLLAALLALPLAGCLAPATGPSPPPPPGPPGAPARETLHLGPDLALGGAAAQAQAMALHWGWAQWLDGTAPPTWRAEPRGTAVRIVNATLELHYQAAAPTAGTQRRPELTAWWGPEGSWVHHAFHDGPDVLLPGARHNATIPLQVPVGGLVLPAGAPLVLALGSYYVDDAQAGAFEVLLGEGATRLEVLLEPFPLAATRPEPAFDETGALEGGECLDLDGLAPTSTQAFELQVPAGAVGLEVVLQRTGGFGPPDMDFSVFAPSGDRIGRSQGPGPEEALTLHAPNIAAGGPGTWTVFLYNCTPQAAQFALRAAVLLPA